MPTIAFGALIFGRMSDKLGRKRLLIVTLLLYLLGTGLAAFVTGHHSGWLVFFYATRFIAGMGIGGIEPASRRLLLADEQAGLRFILLKPADIPTYVEYGAADLGIVGKDILLEQQPDVYEPVDLGFGFCRLVVAEPRELWERDDPARWSWVRVATKYPRLTEGYFSERGIQVEMVRLDGSIELAPLVGLAERIVDLVQSGETLRANGREWSDIAGEVGGTGEARRKQLTRAIARVSRELGLDDEEAADE